MAVSSATEAQGNLPADLDVALVDWRASPRRLALIDALRGGDKPVPLILMLPHVVPEAEEARIAAFHCATIRKPLRIEQLRSAVRSARSGEIDAPARVRPAAPVEELLPPLRILIAEDNRTNRLVIEKLLAKEPIELRFAEDGSKAVNAFVMDPPDVVLMDLSMPVMDGCEAARTIRAWEAERERDAVPIIALTANALPHDRERCLAAGMDGHLAKPVRRAELVATIRQHVCDARAASAA